MTKVYEGAFKDYGWKNVKIWIEFSVDKLIQECSTYFGWNLIDPNKKDQNSKEKVQTQIWEHGI